MLLFHKPSPLHPTAAMGEGGLEPGGGSAVCRQSRKKPLGFREEKKKQKKKNNPFAPPGITAAIQEKYPQLCIVTQPSLG